MPDPTYNDIMGRPDPVLSNIAITHERPDVVGHQLAPVITVFERSFKVAEFDRSMRRRPPRTQRPEHARANETGFNFRFRTLDVEEHALSFPYSDKQRKEYDKIGGRAGAAALFNLERDGVLHVEGQLQMSREETIADTVRTNDVPGEVTAAGAKWDLDATNLPAVARRARKSVWDLERKVVNTLLLPWNAKEVAMWSPSTRAFLGQNTAQFVDDEMLKRVFQVENIIVGAEHLDVGLSPDPFAPPVYEDVWGNDAIFCYVPPEALRSLRAPDAFAYTIRYGMTNNEGGTDSAQALAAIQGEDASIPVDAWYEPGTKTHYRRATYEEKTRLINPRLGYVAREVLTNA